jgi:hypothetical protein
MTRLPGLLVLAAVVSACSGSSTSPSAPAPVLITILPFPAPDGPDTKTFGMEVRNVSQAPVDLTFPSSCAMRPHIVDPAGREVTPLGGGQACATVITHLSLAVAQSLVLPVIVVAGDAPKSSLVVVPPGDYMIYASLEDDKYQIRSARVRFSVR